jgi:NAD(P)-dependent dehydrogenase (short-subunit alcohol dehydrogenase family)
MAKFYNKSVLITGGAQGIGKALSLAFASEGAKVIAVDCDKEAIYELQEFSIKIGLEIWAVEADISKASEIKLLMDSVRDETRRLDILIHNAGLSIFKPIEELDLEEYDHIINTNLRPVFALSKECIPFFKKQNSGIILNIASTRALMSEPDSEAYAASKGGILALTHALAMSLSKYNVRVNAISPGWIEVRDWQKNNKKQKVQHSEADKNQHPVGRVGKPEDIAKAALYLCSDDAGFITGQNMVIDGGMTIKMIYM